MALFIDEQFQPEAASDERLRIFLTDLVANDVGKIDPQTVVRTAMASEDAQVAEAFGTERSTHPPSRHDSKEVGLRYVTRESFAPRLLEAVDELDQLLEQNQQALRPILLELFLIAVLRRLAEDDLTAFRELRVSEILGRLRQRVVTFLVVELGGGLIAQGVSRLLSGLAGIELEGASNAGGPVGSMPRPFLLPPRLAPSDDLTCRAERAGPQAASPYEGDRQFDRLFEMVARALHRRTASHVLLVGERGVGHTMVLTEIARQALMGRIPFLKEKRVVLVDARHTVAEESRDRLLAILSHVAPYAELLLGIDGFATLLKNMRGSTNKPALLSALGSIRCRIIGLMTPREYAELVADDAEMLEFFTPVEIREPELTTALKLANHFARLLAAEHQVRIDEAAVYLAVVLSENYILNERLPSKALRILQRVCQDASFERTQLGQSRDQIAADDVIRVVAEISGVPEETLHGIAERSDYERSIQEEIFGQEHAVKEVANELGLIKAGLTDPDKPASVMLFVGQTGTGKTEMAKALARFYSNSKRLRTYTLGNFIEPHSVSGLIGVPAGYVGHDLGGPLINDLNSDPYCVFLLDEADKSHPDVLQPFLNLFDEGWVRDQRGMQAYANKSIFILTTNVGQRMIADMVKQGKGVDEITARMKEALGRIKHSKSNRPVFAPEFLARIKRVIVFQPLDRAAMEGICRKLIGQASRMWREKRQKALMVPDSLIQHIADEAFRLDQASEGREGGRLVRRMIADLIESPIQRAISASPNEYRASQAVALRFVTPGVNAESTGAESSQKPRIAVSFERHPEPSLA